MIKAKAKKCIEALKKLIRKIVSHFKLKHKDDVWHSMFCGSCFGTHPPSFYHKHTEEEIKQIEEETLAQMRAMYEEYIAEVKSREEDEKVDNKQSR